MKDKIQIHWWEDSYNRITCHKNTPGLTFNESYLGIVGGSNSDGWHFVMSGSTQKSDMFNSQGEARKALEEAVNGGRIDY